MNQEPSTMNRRARKRIQVFLSQSSFTILVLFLIGIFTFPACESRKTIVNGVEEREANEIVVFLASKNIDAYKIPTKAEGGAGGGASKVILYDIAVDSDKATEAMAILSAQGLPRRRGQQLLDIFSAGGLVPSEMQELIRYQSGLAAQIASTIRKIDGVIDADVQLSIPKEDPLNPTAPKRPVTASVYVKHTGVLDDPNSHLIPKIKRLVASSVPGLNYDDVTVIPDRARFAEVTSFTKAPTMEVDYVRVWGVVVAKDSLTRFQMLFFLFCILILILFLALLWVSWKLFPLLRKRGGILQILKIKALPDLPLEEKPVEAPKEEAKEEPKEGAPKEEKKPEEKKPEPKVQENIEK